MPHTADVRLLIRATSLRALPKGAYELVLEVKPDPPVPPPSSGRGRHDRRSTAPQSASQQKGGAADAE
jgi:hypothetical protein